MLRLRFLVILGLLSIIFIGCTSMVYQRMEKERQLRARQYTNEHPDLDLRVKTSIIDGKVRLGMTTEQVRASWGKPYDINRSIGSWGIHEQWVYYHLGRRDPYYLYFENDSLTGWQD